MRGAAQCTKEKKSNAKSEYNSATVSPQKTGCHARQIPKHAAPQQKRAEEAESKTKNKKKKKQERDSTAVKTKERSRQLGGRERAKKKEEEKENRTKTKTKQIGDVLFPPVTRTANTSRNDAEEKRL
jgi:hypothetical protein